MYKLLQGDCLDHLKRIPSNSIDSLVTDPPAGIKIFGHDWDSDNGGRSQWVSWLSSVMKECHRVLKPGAHGLVWALPKKSHWTAMALEDAGFKIRDVISHIFATGFPKSQDLEKAFLNANYIDPDEVLAVVKWLRQRKDELGFSNSDLDKAVGISGGACHWTNTNNPKQASVPPYKRWIKLRDFIRPVPKEISQIIEKQKSNEEQLRRKKLAEIWKGWGTDLKPAHEHWILVQKEPQYSNIASNVYSYKTGCLNIDESRIHTDEKIAESKSPKMGCGLWDKGVERTYIYKPHAKGRFPSNVLLTPTPQHKENGMDTTDRFMADFRKSGEFFKKLPPMVFSRKPTKKEKGEDNDHPTVKSIDLMKYLCCLTTPKEGTIIDPFMGSGSTGVAALESDFKFIGIEKDKKYFKLAQTRVTNVIGEAG